MTRRTKVMVLGAAGLLAAAIGTGAVLASAGDDDEPLRGAARARASSAALEHVGGGTVIETEAGDDGAAYGVEIRKDDGSVVEVSLDSDFTVTAVEGDDDAQEEAGEDDD